MYIWAVFRPEAVAGLLVRAKYMLDEPEGPHFLT